MRYKLEDICTSIVRGPFGSALKKEFFVEKSVETYKVYEQGNAIRKSTDYGNYYINSLKFNELNRFEVKPYDFIMSCSGTIGELYQLPKDAERGLINQALLKMTVNTNIVDYEYFRYIFIYSTSLFESKGSGIKNVASVKVLKAIEFEIPSLERQREIVGVLNTLKYIVEGRSRQVSEYDNLIKSRFIEMFGDPVNGESKFNKVAIVKVTESKINKAKSEFKQDSEIRYIDISSVDNKQNVITGYSKYIFLDAPSRAQQCVIHGDIVISTVRPNLRNVAMVVDRYTNLVASSGFCVLRTKESINNQYLYSIVNTQEFADYLSGLTSGANYPAVNANIIKSFEIPLPPMELQKQYAEFVELVGRLKSEVVKSLDETHILFDSLMQEYFE